MNQAELFYLAPYIFSLALSLGIFTYTWWHRSVHGARIYSWFVAGQTLTIFGFILELISPDLEIKLLWDKFQWLTDSFLVILPFLIFSVQFSENKFRHPRLVWGTWLVLPILFTLLLLTDSHHHLIYPNPHLSLDYPFPELKYDFTFVVYGFSLLYVYGANIYGIGILIRRALQPYNAARFQYWTVAVGFLVPIALSLLSLLNIRVTPQRDISPISFAIGNLIVAWGLFRYRLFNLVPIARERVLENLSDAIIVLDASNRVVDINQVALTNIGKRSEQVIGYPVQEVFAKWPDLIERIQNLEDATLEVSAKVQGKQKTYDLSISPIRDDRNNLIGRTFIVHDITNRKMLEERYRQLSEELEQRVSERTDELRKITERYRAVIENQTEFIVRWKAEGVRTFTNEAYRRYFDLTLEEATSSSFMPLIAEEDRQAVEEKISRLRSGSVAAETEIHRVIKPDGSIGWQEWVDQAIHDETGQIIEFQSVGRDITERVKAEDALRESEERLRIFVQQNIDGIILVNPEGVVAEWNYNMEKLSGFSSDEMNGLKIWEVHFYINRDDKPTPERFRQVEEAYRRILHTGIVPKHVQSRETDLTQKDGGRIILEQAVFTIKTGQGFWMGVIARDLTERVQAEKALREKTDELERFFLSALDLLAIADTDGYFRRLNREWEKVLGYRLADLEGMRFLDLVHPEDQDATLAALAKLDSQKEIIAAKMAHIAGSNGGQFHMAN